MTHVTGAQDLLTRCDRVLPAALSLLRDMVAINSFTFNTKGVSQVGQLTANAFKPLGFSAEWVKSDNPDHADHLVLSRPGSGPNSIAFVSHLDTVFPAEEERQNSFQWREVGDRIYGPGTIDIKGGTVMVHLILTILRDCAPAMFEAVNWQFFLNSAEEVPSPDFGRLCRERIPANARAALVMEGGANDPGGHVLVRARKGRALFRVTVHGRGAHAGSLHRRGANALTQLAHTIQRIESLTDHSAELTFNVGAVSGGSIANRVPHLAQAEVEMRAFDPAVFGKGRDTLFALRNDIVVKSVEDGFPCRVEVEQISELPPWPRNPNSDRLLDVWQQVGKELGVPTVCQVRGGVSDGNHICASVPTIDGLGPCGDNAHCSEQSPDGSKEQEYVRRDSIAPGAALSVASLCRLLD